MLASLILPIVLCAIVLFVASALSWMVSPLHKADWPKMPNEDAFMKGAAAANPPHGNYMFPGFANPAEMATPEGKKKYADGPRGVVTFMPPVSMGRNLGLTFAYFLASTFCIAYLGTIALPAGTDFMKGFRFFATAGFLVHLSAIVPHSVWFRNRIAGTAVEAVVFAAIIGGILGGMWPKA